MTGIIQLFSGKEEFVCWSFRS